MLWITAISACSLGVAFPWSRDSIFAAARQIDPYRFRNEAADQLGGFGSVLLQRLGVNAQRDLWAGVPKVATCYWIGAALRGDRICNRMSVCVDLVQPLVAGNGNLNRLA